MRGITVKLYQETETGTNTFGEAVYEKTAVDVDNVLVAPATAQEMTDTVDLYGRQAVYTLAIPKGDTHEWENKTVEFFGEQWETFGIPLKGIDDLVPTPWNMKVTVARHE